VHFVFLYSILDFHGLFFSKLDLSFHLIIPCRAGYPYSFLLRVAEEQSTSHSFYRSNNKPGSDIINRAQILAFAAHTPSLFRNAEAILIMNYEWSFRNLKVPIRPKADGHLFDFVRISLCETCKTTRACQMYRFPSRVMCFATFIRVASSVAHCLATRH
jgi:hypothetical protein